MENETQPSASENPKPKTIRDVNQQHRESMNSGEVLALFITEHVGTMGFFFIILGWTVLWLGWNLLAPSNLRFDPPTGFVFWLFISNMIQLFLLPLLMIGQNLQSRHAEMRTESDYDVNVAAAEAIEGIVRRQEEHQRLLEAILERVYEKSS